MKVNQESHPMMRRFPARVFVIPTITAYMLLAVASCSGSGATSREFRKYDPLPYADTFQLNASQEVVHRAAIAALQDRGAVVTLSDPRTGLISAELYSSKLLPEDVYASKANDDNESAGGGVMAVVGAILGVILFILLLGWLSDGCSTGTSSGPNRRSTSSPPNIPEPVTANTYVVSLTLVPTPGDSTEMRMNVLRQKVENGTVTSSQRLQNKYLNYSLRDAVEAAIAR
ncbi:MAG: hypothetical protein HW389_3514 [Bacteroidetes bacterium]|nr:hypothetical protein [Bacteroidota bacterium]MBM2846484.1 hypothetical protein [Bacteroidota bacterium]